MDIMVAITGGNRCVHAKAVDGELGIRDVLGPHTVIGFGLAGTTIHPDQLSAYRLGGLLDLTAEFPYRKP